MRPTPPSGQWRPWHGGRLEIAKVAKFRHGHRRSAPPADHRAPRLPRPDLNRRGTGARQEVGRHRGIDRRASERAGRRNTSAGSFYHSGWFFPNFCRSRRQKSWLSVGQSAIISSPSGTPHQARWFPPHSPMSPPPARLPAGPSPPGRWRPWPGGFPATGHGRALNHTVDSPNDASCRGAPGWHSRRTVSLEGF